MYPNTLARWKMVHDVLNVRRTFTGPFTQRVGL